MSPRPWRPGARCRLRVDARGRHPRRASTARCTCTASGSASTTHGNIVALAARASSASRSSTGTPLERWSRTESTRPSVEGVSRLAVQIPHLAVELHSPSAAGPAAVVALGRPHAHRVRDGDVDRRAGARPAGKDPVAVSARAARRHPRHVARAQARGEKAGWGSRAARGPSARASPSTSRSARCRARRSPRSRCKPNGMPKVERVVCAVDCGIAINPDVVARADGGRHRLRPLGALYGEITLEDGPRRADATSTTTESLRIDEMPKVEVHIVPSAGRRPASASPACRRSRPRSPTPCFS